MRQILIAVFFFSTGAFAVQDVAANGKKCESLPNNEKDACYQFMHQCERMYLQPAANQHAPGSNEDQIIDTAYDDAGFQVSRTDGITPNTAVASQACSAQLPQRDAETTALDGLAGTCTKSQGVNNKMKCNDFTVSYDRGGPQQGMCDYIQHDAGIINTKFDHEKAACAGVKVTGKSAADSGG
jgi:hypothetical protein